MSNKTARTFIAGSTAAACIAGICAVATPALAAPTIVNNADEFTQEVSSLSAGDHTINFSGDFEALPGLVKLSVPAGVNLTLDSSAPNGTTIKLAQDNAAKHMELTAGAGSTIAINDLHFEGHNDPNRASFSNEVAGGGLTLRNFTDVKVNNSSFQGNTGAGLSPGNPANLLIESSTFAGNHTGSSGAAFSVDRNTDAILRNSTIHNNRGDGNGYDGGAVKLEFGAELNVSDSLFTENESGRRGAAIGFQNSEGILTVKDSVFADNEVTTSTTAAHTTYNDGGAISVSERNDVNAQTPTVRISGSTFDSNTAGDEAGAILAQGGKSSDFVIENSTFVDNRSRGQDTASNSDSLSGGGAIEAYGTPLTLVNNTFVRNVSERGNATSTQNGAAVSITGGFSSLPTQNLYSAHNVFLGNMLLKDDGTVDESKTTSSVYATSTKLKNLDGVAITGLMGPDEGNTNVGLDAYKAFDKEAINLETVFGTSTPQLASNGNAKVAGDPNGVTATPKTLLVAPNDGTLVTGPADNIGAAAAGLTVDQRGLPMDNPADAGATQSAFVHFDPNGGNWAALSETPFDGSQQVAMDEDAQAHIYRSAPVGATVQIPQAPDVAPTGMEFVGWNSEADGSGATLNALRSGATAQNQTWFAQWEQTSVPPVAGTVTVKHVDGDGNDLSAPEVKNGDIGQGWEATPLQIEGYELDHVVGDESGEFSEDSVVVTFVYKKEQPTPTPTPTDPTPTPTDPTPTPTDPTPTPTDPTPTPTDPTPTPTDPTPTPTFPTPTPTNGTPSPGLTATPTPHKTVVVLGDTKSQGLAKTGSAVAATAAVSALLLMSAGGILYLLRRRHGNI